MDTVIWNFVDCVDDDEWIGNRHAVGIGRDGTDTPYTQYKIKLSKSLQKITSKLL